MTVIDQPLAGAGMALIILVVLLVVLGSGGGKR